MNNKICCFAGHSGIIETENLKLKVYEKCEELITDCGVTIFWVGHYGDFDRLAANCVRELKEKYPNIRLELILPYVTKSISRCKEIFYHNFDCMIMADMNEKIPKRYRIIKCNQYMVNNSSYLIAYVNYSFGGAAMTLEYARKKEITVFNFGNYKP